MTYGSLRSFFRLIGQEGPDVHPVEVAELLAANDLDVEEAP